MIEKIKKFKKSKIFLVGGMVGIFVFGAYLFVRAQSVSDDFSTLDYVAETWNTAVATSSGVVKLAELSCNDSTWFCSLNNVCESDLDDGDYIIVARTDASSTQYKWKPTNTACERPQCGEDGGQDGDNLVADNTIILEGYPARQACKDMGGRLPTKDELNCIYANKTSFGDNYQSTSYWSATEHYADFADYQSFANGAQGPTSKSNAYYVRCVFGR